MLLLLVSVSNVNRSGLEKFHLCRVGNKEGVVVAWKEWAGVGHWGRCQSLKRAYLHLGVQRHTALELQRPGRDERGDVLHARKVRTCSNVSHSKVEFVTLSA